MTPAWNRNLLLHFIFLLIGTSAIYAQPGDSTTSTRPTRSVTVQFGVRFGPSIYTMSGNEVDLRTKRGASLKKRVGLDIGIDTRLNLGNYFYTYLGIGYLEKGGHLDGGGWTYHTPVETSYLTIPLAIGFTSGNNGIVNMSAEIGLAYNHLLSSKNDYSKDIVTGYYTEENKNITSYLYGFEIATSALSRVTLFLNYRNTRDLDFFHTRKNDRTREDYDLWNKGYSVALGLRFRCKA